VHFLSSTPFSSRAARRLQTPSCDPVGTFVCQALLTLFFRVQLAACSRACGCVLGCVCATVVVPQWACRCGLSRQEHGVAVSEMRAAGYEHKATPLADARRSAPPMHPAACVCVPPLPPRTCICACTPLSTCQACAEDLTRFSPLVPRRVA
jgi:hypothetical protein